MLNLPLRSLSSAFDVPEVCKGYFPYLLLSKENADLCLDEYPDISLYGTKHWRQEEYDLFLKFYNANRHRAFSFREEIFNYTQSGQFNNFSLKRQFLDVTLLRKAATKFNNLLLSTSNIAAFQRNLTIGSCAITSSNYFCLIMFLVYLINYLNDHKIGIIGDECLVRRTNQSTLAFKFMAWLHQNQGLIIHHRQWGAQGEVQCGRYFLGILYLFKSL
jgi:hypothetical protein